MSSMQRKRFALTRTTIPAGHLSAPHRDITQWPSCIPHDVRQQIARLRTERRDAYVEDLADTWEMLTTSAATIASKHSKSLKKVETDLHFSRTLKVQRKKRNIWNAFCWKKRKELRQSKWFLPVIYIANQGKRRDHSFRQAHA